jgi:lysophospholipase L1-like esterase
MKVVLVGDSIRLGYQQYVQSELSGFAEVTGSEGNGGSSQKVLDHLDRCVIDLAPDVVHLNAGLHDIRRPIGGTVNQVTLEDYYRNIGTITERIRNETGARLIWATSTPFDEKAHNEVHETMRDFRRFAADLAVYNEGLLDQARLLELEINDLNAVVLKAGPEKLLDTDGVHFTDEGYEILGKAVADFIRLSD